MLKNHLYNELIKYFKYEVTDDQNKLFKIFSDFCFSVVDRPVMIINGYAGTGKTSAISCITDVLVNSGLKFDLLASTGRAAKVLSGFCNKPALTVHKRIYRQKASKDGMGNFVLNVNLSPNTIFIVDEASMIANYSGDSNIFGSGRLLDDLLEFVFSADNCRLVIVGDEAQLPPVSEQKSLAMENSYYKSNHCNIYECQLKQVTRQAFDSGILTNATIIRTAIEFNSTLTNLLQTNNYLDIINLDNLSFLEELEDCYSKYGNDDVIIISRSNKVANMYNQGVRSRVLWREEELCHGDKLLVVKNNYFWLPDEDKTGFIANGDFVIVDRIKKYQNLHGFRFADCNLIMPDYDNFEIEAKVMLNAIAFDGPSISNEDNKKLYNSVYLDYADIMPAKKRYEKIKSDPYYNALQVKFGYALTCHKAQGGQWKAVFIDFGSFAREDSSIEMLKWVYTAFTRATERLYLINFPKNFFAT